MDMFEQQAGVNHCSHASLRGHRFSLRFSLGLGLGSCFRRCLGLGFRRSLFGPGVIDVLVRELGDEIQYAFATLVYILFIIGCLLQLLPKCLLFLFLLHQEF